jgi:hypothetical protein
MRKGCNRLLGGSMFKRLVFSTLLGLATLLPASFANAASYNWVFLDQPSFSTATLRGSFVTDSNGVVTLAAWNFHPELDLITSANILPPSGQDTHYEFGLIGPNGFLVTGLPPTSPQPFGFITFVQQVLVQGVLRPEFLISLQGGATFEGVFDLTPTPLPAALPLFAGGLGVLGFVAHRRKRRALAA